MKKRTRLAALALAIALCANLVPLQVLAEGEGDPSGDDSSTEFVGAIRLEEIFNVCLLYTSASFCMGRCLDGISMQVDDEPISHVGFANASDIFYQYVLPKVEEE